MIPLTQDFGKQKTAKIFLIITFFLEILQLLPKLAKFSFNTATFWAKYLSLLCVGKAIDICKPKKDCRKTIVFWVAIRAQQTATQKFTKRSIAEQCENVNWDCSKFVANAVAHCVGMLQANKSSNQKRMFTKLFDLTLKFFWFILNRLLQAVRWLKV
ncbi:MAG: hypothetical protein IJD18_04560 [Clostridia bacterium]|nr:hypothetical protein [Clostridia bacterium]MBQ3067283.1 hypothetical protein [Clostridia bacterium]